MCIMATDAKPNKTRLFSIPVTYSAGAGDGGAMTHRGTAIVYVNNLDATPSHKWLPRWGSRKSELMIVPFPNPGGEAALDAVVLTPFTEWKGLTKAMEEHMKPVTDGKSPQSRSATNSRQAMVHRIGKYKCSVVANAAALLAGIDWAQFNVPEDLEHRLQVLHDERVCPRTCGFVVAQAVEDVRDDGFAIVYPGDDIFLPTCHEAPAGGGAMVNYDAACYVMSDTSVPQPTWNFATPMEKTWDIIKYDADAHASASVSAAAAAAADGMLDRFYTDSGLLTQLRRATVIAGTVVGSGAAARVRVSLPAGGFRLSRLMLVGADVNTNLYVSGTGDFDPNNPARKITVDEVARALASIRSDDATPPHLRSARVSAFDSVFDSDGNDFTREEMLAATGYATREELMAATALKF